MKNATKKLLKKLLSMALVLAAICTVTIFAAVSSYAAEDIIPIPDFPIIRAPYATDEIFDVDLAAIDALFPRELEMTYENGVISVKDFGAGIIEYNNGNIRTEMTLTDGYWTAEVGDRNNLPYEFFYVYSSDGVNTKQGRVWHVSYYYSERDPYIVLTDYDQNVALTVAYDYEYIGNSYETDNHSYNDDYRNGVLTKHEVSPLATGDLSDITYDADRNILYLSFYFFDDTGWIYYFPEKGWSASWASYSPTEAPAGYDEELDLDYYRSLAPAICMEHPSWENSACTLCGYVCSHENGIDTTTGGCADCGESLATVKLTLADGTTVYYLTLEQAISQARGNADSVITLLADCTPVERGWYEIEDGEFYIDLNGFDILTRGNTSIFMSDATLTIFDDSETPGSLAEMFNMTPGSECIINGGIYQYIQLHENTKLEFQNGTVTERILLSYPASTTVKLSGGQLNEIYAASTYNLFNTLSQGYFFFGENGKILKAEDIRDPEILTKVTVGTHTDADHRGGEANCTHGAICEICDEEYTATNPDNHKWDEGTVTTEPNCTEPGVKTFICEHNSEHTKTQAVDPVAENHKWDEGTVTTEPNCTEPGVKTFICEHNSEHTKTQAVDPVAENHKWDEGTVTTEPNCTEPGVKTFICEHNSEHTKTQAVDPVAENHKWDEGTVTTEPNCTEPGVKTFICEHNSEHTKTEAIDPVAENHKWDEGTVTTEPNCTIPGTKTFTCQHNSTHTRTEPVDIVADAHKWDNGTVTTPPTCTDKGEKTLVCEHNVQHTKTEEIDSLGGHKYDNACDPDCNECGATRTPAAHFSENADGKCDECGESFKLSGGAIAGIATGSTAVVGLGGFSLFWFVIKKKKFSDLFGK